MTLHEQHMLHVNRVNNARTRQEHREADVYLMGWRAGVTATFTPLDLCAADMEQINRGSVRPMCCGVFLDWKPTNES